MFRSFMCCVRLYIYYILHKTRNKSECTIGCDYVKVTNFRAPLKIEVIKRPLGRYLKRKIISIQLANTLHD